VSPFLDDSVEETTAHILQGDFFFSPEYFKDVSDEGKELISNLLQVLPQTRGSASTILLHPWFQMVSIDIYHSPVLWIVRVRAGDRGAWELLRRWSDKPDVVGSISVTTEFFLISCDSNQVPKWFGTHYNLEVPL